MPKKQAQNFTKPQSSYVHPSLSSTRNTPPSPSSKSVNDLIHESRREQAAKDGAQRSSAFADVQSQRTVPPNLRHILNLPETAPPRPRLGHTRFAERGRRVPGPAAPRSWLTSSRHAPEHLRRAAPYQPKKAFRSHDLSSVARAWGNEPPRQSLVHQVLKTMAMNWDDLVEYEQHYLATLPIPLKSQLLSYITMYGPAEGVTIKTLRTLFKSADEVPDSTGSYEITMLDLSGIIGPSLSLSDLNRYIDAASSRTVAEEFKKLSTKDHDSSVAESWEDEEQPSRSVVLRELSTARFPNLTHLSLSHPKTVSWLHLLNLSSHLPKLTHLSLAYWPVPTLTPNALATSMTGQPGSSVSFGGASYYRSLGNDWHEAASVLRRLSNNTYGLKWLDLEGCEWIPALAFGASWRENGLHEDPASGTPVRSLRGAEDWDSNRNLMPCPDWNGSWAQVEYVNVSQGWVPADVNAVRALPAGMLGCQLLEFLRFRDHEEERAASSRGRLNEASVRVWFEKENNARVVANTIRNVRLAARGKVCIFDHGWTPPAAFAKNAKNGESNS